MMKLTLAVTNPDDTAPLFNAMKSLCKFVFSFRLCIGIGSLVLMASLTPPSVERLGRP